jgi:hypothetical protein
MSYEMMIDLETLDTKNSAVVLSIGAVVWETFTDHGDGPSPLVWAARDKFQRVLEIDSQITHRRTVSESTLLWWMQQDRTAKQEAFSSVRAPSSEVIADFFHWAKDLGVDVFWASPATFDFPIWEDLANDYRLSVPWTYRQKYDVRTVVREAGYSVSDHTYKVGKGVAHTPVFDCEMQIDLLTAARVKTKSGITEKNS